MKTKLKLALLCFSLCTAPLFAQQNTNEPKVTITKKITEPDGTSVVETTVKKGQAARDFDIDAYIKEHKADNVDLDIRAEIGDEERYITIKGSAGPQSRRYRSFEEEVTREVEKTVNWVGGQIKGIEDVKISVTGKAFLGVEEDSDEDEDEKGLVIEVIPNSAADLAGLRHNDKIISLNDTPIDDWDDLTAFMQNAKRGDSLRIVYQRNSQEYTTQAILTSRAEVKPVDCTKAAPRGFLGVNNSYDSDDDMGAKVNVVKKSAADNAGLKNGDILIQLNDTPIKDYEDIEDFMEYIHPGDKIQVKFQREGKTETVEVTAGKAASWDYDSGAAPEMNINIRTKEACMGIYNGSVPAGNRPGANIVNFTANSSAKAAGLQIGDVILSVSGERVQNSDELWEALATYHPSDKVTIGYIRNGQEMELEMTLDACSDASSMVKINKADEDGNNSERQFYSLNMDEGDAEKILTRQTITIRKGNQSDTPVINPTTGNESNPTMKERSLHLDYIKISPNPSSGPLTVTFKGPAIPTIVNIYDLGGHQLFQEELNIFDGEYMQEFDLSEFVKSGVLLRIQQGEKFYSEQILIN